ncbi:MAG: hypothetical protein ABIK08_02740 [Pseudomonadota bacterium]
MNTKQYLACLVTLSLLVAGCTGVRTFSASARPGETIALAAGWKQQLTRNDLTVVITPASGEVVTYNPGDPRVRALFQLYPDPVSKLVVSDRSGVSYPNAGLSNYAGGFNTLGAEFGSWFVRPMAGNQNDWSDTMVLLDLPTTLAPGEASIAFMAGGVNVMQQPALVEVLPLPAGAQNQLELGDNTGAPGPIRSIERAPHYVVHFSGPTGVIPHSIQAEFTRTLSTTGGSWVTQGRGDIMNLTWADTGSSIKVLRSPVNGVSSTLLADFDFYVTGAVTTLALNTIKAYDISGNALTGFSASLQYVSN